MIEIPGGALAATTLSSVPSVTLQVLYSCELCGVEDRQVEVRERHGTAEDVRDWMKYVIEEVCRDHTALSNCRAVELKCLKIPVVDCKDTFVGKAPRQ